jgi:hypothetical protein
MWQIINNKKGNSGNVYQNIRLQNNGKKIIHLLEVTDTFNSHFINKVEELVGKNRNKAGYKSLQKVVDGNPKSIYFGPISEEEIASEVSKLKGKASVDVIGFLSSYKKPVSNA